MKCHGSHLHVTLGISKVYPCGTQAFVTQLLYKLLRHERIRKSDRYVKSTSRLRKSFDLRKKKCDYTIRYDSHSLGTVEALATVDRGQTLRTHFAPTNYTNTYMRKNLPDIYTKILYTSDYNKK